MKSKKCIDCQKVVLERDFYKDSTKVNGYKSYCKTCARKRVTKYKKTKGSDYLKDRRLMDVYGITLETYNKMFLEQKGCCYICKNHQSLFQRSLAVDHCHRTGKVRALLCDKCNVALGLVDDNIELLKLMISYLSTHSFSRFLR